VAEGTGTLPDLQTVARLLGGRVNGNSVLCPGPNHSANDRSLSVKIDPNAPDGFLVHSFASDDPIVCRDYVRQKLGLPAFKPNRNGTRPTEADIERAVMAVPGYALAGLIKQGLDRGIGPEMVREAARGTSRRLTEMHAEQLGTKAA